MDEDQRNARIFGVLFIITFLTSIPAVLLFQPVLDDPAGYIAGRGNDNQIYLGASLELLLIIANVGTAVVLYPIARRQNKTLAIGYVAARIIECVFLAAGIIFVLGVVSLRQDSPDAADLAVGAVAWHLRGRLGIPAGCSDSSARARERFACLSPRRPGCLVRRPSTRQNR